MKLNRLTLIACLVFVPHFVSAQYYKNSVIATIEEAAPLDQAMAKVGDHVTITGLDSKVATWVWPISIDQKMTKIGDNNVLMVFQFVSGIGSTDTLYLDKVNKKFLLVSVSTVLNSSGKPMSFWQYRGSFE